MARKRPAGQKYDLAKISNGLIEAFVRQNNLVAMKILFYVARSNLELPPESEKEGRKMITLTIDKFRLCEYCGIAQPTLNAYVRRMVETSICIKKGKQTTYMSVIPSATFTDGGGELKIDIYREVLDLIWQVRNKFTVIDIPQLMKLRSKHSVRMLQLLELIAGFDEGVAKRKHYTHEELNGLFGTKYERMVDFERNVLRLAKEEMDANSRLSFTYRVEYQKVGGAGRPAAMGVAIDLVDNVPQPSLF